MTCACNTAIHSRRTAQSAVNSSSVNDSSAFSRPMMASFVTLPLRPMPCNGLPRSFSFGMSSAGGVQSSNRSPARSSICSSAEPTRSRRPHSMALACGPLMPLPPLMATRSAPISMNRCRFAIGGTPGAASMMTGRSCEWATATTSSSGGCEPGSGAYAMATVCSVMHVSSSQRSTGRTECGSGVSLNTPAGMIRAPAAWIAWS